MHPGHDFGEGERFGHVVVAADGEARHLVLDGVAGGEEEDGDVDAVGPQPSRHLQAVEIGEHDVEDDEIGRTFLGGGQGQTAVDGLFDPEALVAEGGRHRVDDRRLVVHHQDPLVASWLHAPRPSVVDRARPASSTSIAPRFGCRV